MDDCFHCPGIDLLKPPPPLACEVDAYPDRIPGVTTVDIAASIEVRIEKIGIDLLHQGIDRQVDTRAVNTRLGTEDTKGKFPEAFRGRQFHLLLDHLLQNMFQDEVFLRQFVPGHTTHSMAHVFHRNRKRYKIFQPGKQFCLFPIKKSHVGIFPSGEHGPSWPF